MNKEPTQPVVPEAGTVYKTTIDRQYPPKKDGEKPVVKEFELFFRNDAERVGLLRAMRVGNRAQRRAQGHTGEPTPILRTERNKRNAKRRLAKKQRKQNGA